MAFQLKKNELLSDGITRNVRGQIEKALEHLGGKGKPPRHGASEVEAVREVRKCFKKVRAALRLVREDLGDDIYHEENYCFRDAARPLTTVRDAAVLVESADKLREPLVEAMGAEAFARMRKALFANQQEVTRRVLEENSAFARVEEVATRALGRLSDWRLQRDGWDAIETGLRRVYRSGRRALALAAENPSVENLHEWRKQTKYLWHQLQLLEASLASGKKDLVDQAHRLANLLGEDHDLAVLRANLAADPLAYGGHPILKSAFAVLDHRRQQLERQAFALGGEIYKDLPKVFPGRIKASTNYEEVKCVPANLET